ncbi:CHASE2 domain-containing protein [bacterium]|nr:CHASE2 domain-containing protein [bacterium]
MAESNGSSSRRSSIWIWAAGIVGSALLAIMVLFISRVGLFYQLELKTYDLRFTWRGPIELEPDNVAIVAIDDETFLSVPERHPFPRSYYARVNRNLIAAGARLIVWDVQFAEPMNPVQDSILAAATAEAPEKIIHAGKVVVREHKNIQGQQTQLMQPIPEIQAVNENLGIVNEALDIDGFSRRYQLYMTHSDKNYLALAMKALQVVEGMPDTVGLYRKEDHIEFGGREIPTNSPTTMLINFFGPAGHIPTYSFSDVLDDMEFDLRDGDTDYMFWITMSDEMFDVMTMTLDEQAVQLFRELRDDNPFKDKVVFIGASAPELFDLKKTPFFGFKHPETRRRIMETPGVEVHANAFLTLMSEKYITNVEPYVELAMLFVLAFGVFALNHLQRLLFGTVTTFVLGLLIVFTAFYVFIEHRVWLALVAPLLAILVSWMATTLYHYIKEQREKAMIRGMFSQYVPKKVVDALVENPDLMSLGGERRNMTALFTDVAGFTSVSERLSPEELVALLNEYLSEMSKIILDNEGIIDKYEGDLIMAEWGAPVAFEDHAAWACRAALKMQKRLVELREHWKKEGKPMLKSRVGINTGDMIVGNMGCLEVFDYTVMGDAVNLASRLEGANKAYGTTTMIGPETREQLPDTFTIRFLDNLRVKGKDEPVTVYELLCEAPDTLPDYKLKAIKLYEEGLKLFFDMQFADAKEKFDEALEHDPTDGPSRTYLERAIAYINNPPPEDWDKVFVLTEK